MVCTAFPESANVTKDALPAVTEPPLLLTAMIGDVAVPALLDTGAAVSCVSSLLAEELT